MTLLFTLLVLYVLTELSSILMFANSTSLPLDCLRSSDELTDWFRLFGVMATELENESANDGTADGHRVIDDSSQGILGNMPNQLFLLPEIVARIAY